jgi:ketosteroid isomerase-like protein
MMWNKRRELCVTTRVKTIRRNIVVLPVCLILFLCAANPQATHASENELQSRIRQLLDLYARKDAAGVMKLVADEQVLVMGSDLSEISTSREQTADLFRDDFKLWDSSSFGALGKIYSHTSGNLVTAFFDVPFMFRRGKSEQTVVIRFATVWKKTRRGLELVQSLNTTPTVGQSAKELSTPHP